MQLLPSRSASGYVGLSETFNETFDGNNNEFESLLRSLVTAGTIVQGVKVLHAHKVVTTPVSLSYVSHVGRLDSIAICLTKQRLPTCIKQKK